ncbi:MAG: trypsin-like peptidase domain-containing protein, partial [Thermoanaerobaculia bacterium]|nr:trypsin-like peptidase domain-containing protein [Thermoanaerobaculia bacterium]
GPRPVRRGPPPPVPPKDDVPKSGAAFPFLRVAAVTLVIFGIAWAIHSARDVKWSAPLEPEDARLAESRARGINSLLKRDTPAPTNAAASAAARASPEPSPNPPTQPSLSPANPVRPAENALTTALRSVVSITGEVRIGGRTQDVVGSGFFVTNTGMILTNAHVIEPGVVYSGRTHDGRRLNLTDRERSREMDLGLFAAIGEGPFPALPFGSAKGMNYGDQVWAIGSPLAKELGFSVTRGVVSSPLRLFSGRAFLQHDAAINPGNSGGPLVDSAGRLVGVNTWKIVGDTQGLGFAIPVEVVEEVLKTWKIRP